MADKRHFQRVVLNVPGTLSHHQLSIEVIVRDLSLRGVRMQARDDALETLPFDSHDPYHLTFQANQDSPKITAELQQLYRLPTRHTAAATDSRQPHMLLGCKLEHISVESLAVLRRLIELNSLDAERPMQDLNALVEQIYDSASSASES